MCFCVLLHSRWLTAAGRWMKSWWREIDERAEICLTTHTHTQRVKWEEDNLERYRTHKVLEDIRAGTAGGEEASSSSGQSDLSINPSYFSEHCSELSLVHFQLLSEPQWRVAGQWDISFVFHPEVSFYTSGHISDPNTSLAGFLPVWIRQTGRITDPSQKRRRSTTRGILSSGDCFVLYRVALCLKRSRPSSLGTCNIIWIILGV